MLCKNKSTAIIQKNVYVKFNNTYILEYSLSTGSWYSNSVIP